MNKMLIIGYLGTDPEMHQTPNGTNVCRFRIASNRNYTKADGAKEQETEWFNCSAFGAMGDSCFQMLQKGKLAYVEGRFSGSIYTDREGNPHNSNNIVVQQFQALSPSGRRPPAAGVRQPAAGRRRRCYGTGPHRRRRPSLLKEPLVYQRPQETTTLDEAGRFAQAVRRVTRAVGAARQPLHQAHQPAQKMRRGRHPTPKTGVAANDGTTHVPAYPERAGTQPLAG